MTYFDCISFLDESFISEDLFSGNDLKSTPVFVNPYFAPIDFEREEVGRPDRSNDILSNWIYLSSDSLWYLYGGRDPSENLGIRLTKEAQVSSAELNLLASEFIVEAGRLFASSYARENTLGNFKTLLDFSSSETLTEIQPEK